MALVLDLQAVVQEVALEAVQEVALVVDQGVGHLIMVQEVDPVDPVALGLLVLLQVLHSGEGEVVLVHQGHSEEGAVDLEADQVELALQVLIQGLHFEAEEVVQDHQVRLGDGGVDLVHQVHSGEEEVALDPRVLLVLLDLHSEVEVGEVGQALALLSTVNMALHILIMALPTDQQLKIQTLMTLMILVLTDPSQNQRRMLASLKISLTSKLRSQSSSMMTMDLKSDHQEVAEETGDEEGEVVHRALSMDSVLMIMGIRISQRTSTPSIQVGQHEEEEASEVGVVLPGESSGTEEDLHLLQAHFEEDLSEGGVGQVHPEEEGEAPVDLQVGHLEITTTMGHLEGMMKILPTLMMTVVLKESHREIKMTGFTLENPAVHSQT